MNQITLILPLPDKCLSPNARTHWAVKAGATKKHRGYAGLAAASWLGQELEHSPEWKRAEISAIWFRRTRHRLDQDNATAWLKGYADGLQDAGVVKNDSGFVWLPHEFRVDKADPRIELTIRCLDELEK